MRVSTEVTSIRITSALPDLSFLLCIEDNVRELSESAAGVFKRFPSDGCAANKISVRI